MNPFESFQCLGCKLFRQGKCLCYKRKESARGKRDCRSCRCVIVSYILSQKKHTQKIFYHLRKTNKTCGCKLICKLRKETSSCHRIGPNGKKTFVFHKKCAASYIKCKEMKDLEANFRQFQNMVQKTGRLEIPKRCVPFIGTRQRSFDEFRDIHEKCLRKRERVAVKTKLALANGDISTNDSLPSSLSEETEENSINISVDLQSLTNLETQDIIEPIQDYTSGEDRHADDGENSDLSLSFDNATTTTTADGNNSRVALMDHSSAPPEKQADEEEEDSSSILTLVEDLAQYFLLVKDDTNIHPITQVCTLYFN